MYQCLLQESVVGAVRCAQYRQRKEAALKKNIRELCEQPADCVLKVSNVLSPNSLAS